eukprot:TRINITY_DN3836_c0_g1_i3.p1 TRINITY_DN3836_c0_g1~~TRINITY_DN3836_c0_g1_i3.p1  ORF type:complete len:213 (+),score=58.20 TRINITY_DN3836_c0_g1_i3:35-673(+)
MMSISNFVLCFFFFQAEDGIRDLVRSRGLGDVYKRQVDKVSVHEAGLLTLRRMLVQGHAYRDGPKHGPRPEPTPDVPATMSNPLNDNKKESPPIASESESDEDMETEVKSKPDIDVSSMISQSFSRYDLDESGTINTPQELEQLCLHLIFRLEVHTELHVTPAGLSKKLTTVTDAGPVCMDLPEFTQWFSNTFLAAWMKPSECLGHMPSHWR